ncbi:MAG: MATE family efflux transporter [bacterium]
MEKSNVDKKRNLILFDNIWKTLLLISLPVALTSMVTEVFALFDTFFSSEIGKTALSATTFVSPINAIILAISAGLSVAATALIARALAVKDFESAKKYHFQMILITLLVSVVCFVFCLIFAELILKIFGAEEDMLDAAVIYFRLIIISLPLRFYNDIFTGQQRAIGNNRRIMIVNFASIVLKLVLSYVFIYHFEMGIAGLGYSTIASSALISVVGLYVNFIQKDELKITKSDFKIDFAIIATLLIFAMPIIVEKSTQSFGNAFINSFALSLGEDVQSAYGVINRFNSIIFSFSGGFGAALVAIVSQNLVVKNLARIKEAKVKGIILSLAIVSVSLVVLFLVREWLASLFATDSEGNFDYIIYDYIIKGMNVYTISAIPWTVMQIFFGIFQGMKKPRYVFVVSLVRLWLFRVLLVWALINVFNMGADAIWYGMLISNIFAMLASVGIYYFVARKELNLITQPA